MYNYHCQYCNKDYTFQKPQQVGTHKRHCKSNPKHQQYLKKLKRTKKTYTLICKACNKPYILQLTQREFDTGRYKKYCACKEKYKYFIYKITNILNNKIYIGAHYSEDIENDSYLGSGFRLKDAIKKYGKQNFKRQILHQFKTQKEMYQKQAELVNQDFLKRNDVYNLDLGGKGGLQGFVQVITKDGSYIKVTKEQYHSNKDLYKTTLTDKVMARDKEGNILKLSKDDPKWLSGQLVGRSKGTVTALNTLTNQYEVISKEQYHSNKDLYKTTLTGKVIVKDRDGNIFKVSIDDPRYISGQLESNCKDKVMVKDKNGTILKVSKDHPKLLSGQYQITSSFKEKVTVKDKDGNKYFVPTDDPRYLSGQLVHINTGKTTFKDKDGNAFHSTRDDPRYLSGQIQGVSKGLIPVRDKDGNFLKVSKDDPRYLSGQLVHNLKNTTIVRDKDGNKFRVLKDDPRIISGQLKK